MNTIFNSGIFSLGYIIFLVILVVATQLIANIIFSYYVQSTLKCLEKLMIALNKEDIQFKVDNFSITSSNIIIKDEVICCVKKGYILPNQTKIVSLEEVLNYIKNN